MFADVAWQTLAAIAAGAIAVGLVLWIGLRSRSAGAPPADGSAAPAEPPKNLVSRVVSWTSMIQRGGYRGKTKSLHRKGGSVDVLLADPARPDNPVKAWVLERSVHVMTLVAEEALNAGTTSKVRPLNAADNIPWIDVAVQECSQAESEWRIVCKFVKVPPYNILMLFG
jgi:hypothetical protein